MIDKNLQHYKKQQESIDYGKQNEKSHERSLNNKTKSNPQMPVYYDMQKKIPMIYAKKEYLNG